MVGTTTPKFQNDMGVETIEIGAREFECIGATPPLDHPHIYLDMGTSGQVVCPYCSTLFRLNKSMDSDASNPPQAKYSE